MIGVKLRELLALRGMRQAELARRAGAPMTTINSIITRNNKRVDFNLMGRIADVLGVPLDYFYERETDSETETAEGSPAAQNNLTDAEIRFLSTYGSLTQENQHVLNVIAEALLNDEGKLKG